MIKVKSHKRKTANKVTVVRAHMKKAHKKRALKFLKASGKEGGESLYDAYKDRDGKKVKTKYPKGFEKTARRREAIAMTKNANHHDDTHEYFTGIPVRKRKLTSKRKVTYHSRKSK